MSRLALAAGLGLLALELTVLVALLATSDHETSPLLSTALAVTVLVAFVVSGLIALWRRPENRTGVYLAAVGYLWFLGGLEGANNAWIYAFGFAVGNLAWIPFAALLLAYPTGRFETRVERGFPWLVGASLFGLTLAMLAFDPTPDPECTSCPRNPVAITDSERVSHALDVVDTAVGSMLALVAVVLLVRRWRRANPALRRALWPVFAAGGGALASIIVVGLIEQLVSGDLANALWPFFLAFLAAVPAAFLFGVLRTRLARSAVSEVVLELQRGAPTRDTLARALRDPTLEVVYRLPGGSHWVDAEGNAVPEPEATRSRSVTLIDRMGMPIAALEHDPVLDEERGLVDAVTAAAALSIHNERLQAEIRAEAHLTRAVADTAPSLLVNVGVDGRIRNQNRAAVVAAGLDDEELVRGRYFWDVFIDDEERAAVIERFHAAAPDFPASEYENTFTNARGEQRVIYWRSAPVRDETGAVVSIVAGGLDITLRKQRERELERERDFLRATANSIPTLLVLVDEEGVVLDHGANAAFKRVLGYGEQDIVARPIWDVVAPAFEQAALQAAFGRSVGADQGSRTESRWWTSSGEVRLVEWTTVSRVGPDGRPQYLVCANDVTDRRRFEDEIIASRARIVRAEDEARRKLERNLHDGAQQRLVALSVALRLVDSKLRDDPDQASELLTGARQELGHALEELRELARGIHPAVLTDRGLKPALEALIGRATLPVELEMEAARLAPDVEAAAYYVVAEALTNVSKYGQATSAKVHVAASNGSLEVSVADDGIGGANPDDGSGLRGLADRVEALSGRFAVESPVGAGTKISATIPIGDRPTS